MIKRKAYAKINLALDVLGILPNGYHEVCMVMQTIGICDELSFESFDVEDECGERILISLKMGDTSNSSKEKGGIEADKDNIVYKAASKLADRFPEGKGVRIELVKNIPIAAGMAGGSTDAAATLHGVNELFELGLSDDELCKIGVKIGADVPYCILGGTMLAEGIGEKLTALNAVPELILVVAKPEAGVSTKYVYEHLDACENPPHPDVKGMVQAIGEADRETIAKKLGNILEIVTIPACPEVATIKNILEKSGAEGVLMSGSGPTVFAVFSDEAAANRAADTLKMDGTAKDIFVTRTVNV